MSVEITVTCPGNGEPHVLGVWTDRIEEKYPFYCPVCEEDLRQAGSWPWTLTTRIVTEESCE